MIIAVLASVLIATTLWFVVTSVKRTRALKQLLVALPEPPLAEIPDGPTLPSSDQGDEFQLNAGAAPEVVPAHNLLLIEYRDGEGQRSRRRITVRGASLYDADGWLTCYCHERKGIRNFYVSRIESLLDMRTGEVASDALAFFKEMFPPPEPDFTYEAFRSLEPELLILVYIARADTRMVRAERAAIATFVLASFPDLRFDERMLDQRIARISARQPDFQWALKRMHSKPPGARRRLLVAAQAVMAADGKTHEGESKIHQLLTSALT